MLRDNRVVCEGCGQLDEQTTDHLHEIKAKLADVLCRNEAIQDSLAAASSKNKRLQSEQARDIKADPHYPAAMRVLEEWRRLCAPRTRELNGPRLKNAVARLNHGYTEDELMKCVVGYARYPYSVDGKRVAIGPADRRYVDAELIFRTAKHVDAGIALAERDEAKSRIPTSVMAMLDWREVQRANFKILKAALVKQFGQPLVDDTLTSAYLFPCPRCNPEATIRDRSKPTMAELLSDGVPLNLTLVEPGMSYLARCFACGIDEGTLLKALKDPVGLAVV